MSWLQIRIQKSFFSFLQWLLTLDIVKVTFFSSWLSASYHHNAYITYITYITSYVSMSAIYSKRRGLKVFKYDIQDYQFWQMTATIVLQQCTATLALQRLYCNNCIATITLQQSHCNNCTATMHCNNCTARTVLQNCTAHWFITHLKPSVAQTKATTHVGAHLHPCIPASLHPCIPLKTY